MGYCKLPSYIPNSFSIPFEAWRPVACIACYTSRGHHNETELSEWFIYQSEETIRTNLLQKKKKKVSQKVTLEAFIPGSCEGNSQNILLPVCLLSKQGFVFCFCFVWLFFVFGLTYAVTNIPVFCWVFFAINVNIYWFKYFKYILDELFTRAVYFSLHLKFVCLVCSNFILSLKKCAKTKYYYKRTTTYSVGGRGNQKWWWHDIDTTKCLSSPIVYSSDIT